MLQETTNTITIYNYIMLKQIKPKKTYLES